MRRYGIREICNVVFKALSSVDIGGQHFDAGQPVLYIDTAKTSTLEGAATSNYANGGRGNARLLAWEGDKTITFTIEDALMSPMSFAMLSGAGLIKGTEKKPVFVHTTYDLLVQKGADGEFFAELSYETRNGADLVVSKEAPVYPVLLSSSGAQERFLSAVTEKEITPAPAANGIIKTTDAIKFSLKSAEGDPEDTKRDEGIEAGKTVRIDCYTAQYANAQQMEIEAGTFAGYYYIEASTLFRDDETGVDMPAEFIIPRGKIQSNFTFSMANSGDPSTFTFTIDAFPAYTKFDKEKKVMATLQVIEPTATTHNYPNKEIVGHANRTSDADVDKWYTKSIFDAADAGE